jgi:hypothetical protein
MLLENSYFIRLVVILRVIFEDLWLLLVVEGADEVIEVFPFAPGLTFNEPIKRLVCST